MLVLLILGLLTSFADGGIGKYIDGCTPSENTVCNYQRSEGCAAVSVSRPKTKEDVAKVVHDAASNGMKVRAVGVPHSDNSVFCDAGSETSLVMLVMDGFQPVPISLDESSHTVTASGGATVAEVQTYLHKRGQVPPPLPPPPVSSSPYLIMCSFLLCYL